MEMHASTKDKCYDVIVVGAGVEGSATAYNLVKNGGGRVLLLEQVSLFESSPFHKVIVLCSLCS